MSRQITYCQFYQFYYYYYYYYYYYQYYYYWCCYYYYYYYCYYYLSRKCKYCWNNKIFLSSRSTKLVDKNNQIDKSVAVRLNTYDYHVFSLLLIYFLFKYFLFTEKTVPKICLWFCWFHSNLLIIFCFLFSEYFGENETTGDEVPQQSTIFLKLWSKLHLCFIYSWT